MAKVGETLRYEGTLDAALREWTICVVARELSNVFEWDMHLPWAAAAGVPEVALAALDADQASPADLRADLALARRVARELITTHRLTEASCAEAVTLDRKVLPDRAEARQEREALDLGEAVAHELLDLHLAHRVREADLPMLWLHDRLALPPCAVKIRTAA